jgi:hypothetical protein
VSNCRFVRGKCLKVARIDIQAAKELELLLNAMESLHLGAHGLELIFSGAQPFILLL